MPDFEEGDEVEVTIKGHVLWLGEKQLEVDDWVFDLASLRHPGFAIKKTK